ncbi:hypothetical protein YC2023_012373 [Brassica napus]
MLTNTDTTRPKTAHLNIPTKTSLVKLKAAAVLFCLWATGGVNFLCGVAMDYNMTSVPSTLAKRFVSRFSTTIPSRFHLSLTEYETDVERLVFRDRLEGRGQCRCWVSPL